MEVSPVNLTTNLELIPKSELAQRLVESWTSCKRDIALQKNLLFIALFSNSFKEDHSFPKCGAYSLFITRLPIQVNDCL